MLEQLLFKNWKNPSNYGIGKKTEHFSDFKNQVNP